MEQQPSNLKRTSTTKSGILIVIGIVLLVALGAYILMTPGILDSLLTIAIVVGIVIIASVMIIYAAIAIMAIPMYMHKGEQYQDGISYGMDSVKTVENSSSEDRKNE
ncbi:MAG: hypothetical protein J6K69_05835 [Candidatus Methanomethylophilaceae archaeon]|nr:hypothetical protein [Candidatus Methanomethylophilaceae archaeon]MBQ8643639.1 hypothetical protein [Candidatus Methanomethylophilaceae archaeon]MBR2347829.1 hypothetical protein [Candidatus Methanomethylophilaceae archaeon]